MIKYISGDILQSKDVDSIQEINNIIDDNSSLNFPGPKRPWQ